MDVFSTEREMDLLRQRLKADRQRSDRERLELLASMQQAMAEAKKRQAEEAAAVRRQDAFLKQARAEMSKARASFHQDVKRCQAFFDAAAEDSARRRAERTQAAEQQQQRDEQSQSQHGIRPQNGQRLGPSLITTAQQARAHVAFEAAFERFEAADDDVASFTISTVPWPPIDCPVSGMRPTDTPERRKQLLKLSLLRWHPDKFAAAHLGKLRPEERTAVMEKVNATLRRVQTERAVHADRDEEVSASGGSSMAPPPAADYRRTAAAAAARSMASGRAPPANMPRVVRPSRTAAKAPKGAAAKGAGQGVDQGMGRPASARTSYEGRFSYAGRF